MFDNTFSGGPARWIAGACDDKRWYQKYTQRVEISSPVLSQEIMSIAPEFTIEVWVKPERT